MRQLLLVCLIASLAPLIGSAGASDTPVGTVQSLFDAMKAQDADAARSILTPDATLIAIRPDGSQTTTPATKWLERFNPKDVWLERMWEPKVLEQGPLAVVWAPYDFHMNGKFTHCGIDSISLTKSASGWKIAGLVFTRQTEGCAPSPLGPPASSSNSSASRQ